jgi:hypothetical protein
MKDYKPARMTAHRTIPMLLCLALTACQEVTVPAPSTDPIPENIVNIAPGGACSISGISIRPIGSSTGAINLIDGQCEQAWTNLSYREKIPNPAPAKCKVSFKSGFSYRYNYQTPQTNITYYKSSSSYEIPQTIINYYVSSQSYDLPQTKINYYTSRQEYDVPSTNVKYYTQQGSYSLNLPGSFSAQGCAAFVKGKLPTGALTDPAHAPTCREGNPVHKVGACSASDTSIQNCQTVYSQNSLVASGGHQSDCVGFARGKIPASAITGNSHYPITCSATAAKKITGACSTSDPSISNCATDYASKNLTVNGDFSSVGCEKFVAGKIPSGAIFNDASHPISCAASSKKMAGACNPSDSTISKCSTTYSIHSLNNLSGDYKISGCANFSAGKLPSGAVLNDIDHPLTCSEGAPQAKAVDSSELFGNLSSAFLNYTPAVNADCGAELSAHIASVKGLPAPSSCKITGIQTGEYTYNNSTCALAKPNNKCLDSNGAQRDCRAVDIAAEDPYAKSTTTIRAKGNFSCNTLCSNTDFCTSMPGTVGDNFYNCGAQSLANSIDKTFSGIEPGSVACEAGQTKVITKGPYLSRVLPSLTSNVPDNSCVKTRVCLNQTAWKTLTPAKAIPAIDLVILFDTTSSMTPQIQAMIANLKNLIKNLNTLTPKLRLGLASYRDFSEHGGQSGDFPFMVNVPLSSNTNLVANGLNSLTASGGGDLPESLATAIRATVDGKGVENYFGATTMGWENDPTRVKIILGISDAADKKEGLPAGAATLDEAMALLKTQGILFLGIGFKNKVENFAGENAYRSFDDFSFLAQNTGAIVRAPGIDLDGDAKTDSYGELAPGSSGVLLMTESGQVEGAPQNADSTRVLADAIAKMVETTRPFQFNLTVDGSGRKFTPATNSLSVPSQAEGQQCFTQVSFDPKDINAACGVKSAINLSVNEASTSTDISNTKFTASMNIDGNCARQEDPAQTDTAWSVSGFDGATSTDSATLIWQIIGTPRLSTATIRVGLRADQLNLQTITVSAMTPSQVVTINGLAPDTSYYFQLDTKDILGNVVSSAVISKKTKP